MQTILVTGGFGFLGRAVASHFKQLGYRVVGIGRGQWGPEESLVYGFDRWLDASVSLSSLMNLHESFDIVAHCAGNGSVGYSLENPLQDFFKTVQGTAELLEYIRLNNSKAMLVYPSSAAVYGAKDDAPIKETDSLNPISPYGYHKRIVEEMLESYSRNYGIRVAVIRFFSIYGPGLKKQLLWDASEKLLSAQDEVFFWGTGDETRDWINIDDATELIIKAAHLKDKFTIINGASGIRVSVRDTLGMLKAALASNTKISFNNIVKKGDPHFYHADISKMNSIGWTPQVFPQEGIERYVAWLKGLSNG